MNKTITIELPEWAQKRLDKIREIYNDDTYGPNKIPDEQIMLEILADYLTFKEDHEKLWKITEILEIEY